MTKSRNIRKYLSIAGKNEIADFHEKNPGTSIRKLAKIFTMKFDVKVAKSSVHKILKIKSPLRRVPLKFRHKKKIMAELKREFQDEVYKKYLQKLPRTPMTEDNILYLAGHVAREPKFSEKFGNQNFGHKWFKSFSVTYGLVYKKIKGHKKYFPQREIDLAREEARSAMVGYDEDDIYNSDTSAVQLQFNGAMSWQPKEPTENLVINKVCIKIFNRRQS